MAGRATAAHKGELRENRQLQLATYAWLWRQVTVAWPSTSYFIADDAQLLSQAADVPASVRLRRGIRDMHFAGGSPMLAASPM